MSTDIPGPELDDVAVGVGHIEGTPAVVLGEVDDFGFDAPVTKPCLSRVEVGVVDPESEVNVHPAAAACQPDLRPPEADAGSSAGHHPDGLAGRPSFHDRKPENAGVETLGRFEIDDLEDELADAGYGNAVQGHRRPEPLSGRMTQTATPEARQEKRRHEPHEQEPDQLGRRGAVNQEREREDDEQDEAEDEPCSGEEHEPGAAHEGADQGPRSVGQSLQREAQLGSCPGAECELSPLRELLERQPAAHEVLAQRSGCPFTVSVARENHASIVPAYDRRMPDFVPPDFEVPLGLETPEFVLEPLGPEHNERDYDAWTSSIEHIRATPGYPDGRWPREMTRDENRADLERHADDFRKRKGFTYTVLDPASRDVIGCVYIYPSKDGDHDADALSWVRASHAHLDAPLRRAVGAWLESDWPLSRVVYPSRA